MAILKMKYGVSPLMITFKKHPMFEQQDVQGKFGDDIPHIVDLQTAANMGLGGTSERIRRSGPHRRRESKSANLGRSSPFHVRRCRAFEDTDQEEVDASVLFPTSSGSPIRIFQKEGSEEFRLACIRAYNDWLIEEWQDYSPRFIAQCVTPCGTWSCALPRSIAP